MDSEKYGIPEDIISIIQNLYEGGQSSISEVDGLGRRLVHCYNGSKTRVHPVPTTIRCSHRLDRAGLDSARIMRKTLTSLYVGLEWINGKRFFDLCR